jgi:hypothetical protein
MLSGSATTAKRLSPRSRSIPTYVTPQSSFDLYHRTTCDICPFLPQPQPPIMKPEAMRHYDLSSIAKCRISSILRASCFDSIFYPDHPDRVSPKLLITDNLSDSICIFFQPGISPPTRAPIAALKLRSTESQNPHPLAEMREKGGAPASNYPARIELLHTSECCNYLLLLLLFVVDARGAGGGGVGIG